MPLLRRKRKTKDPKNEILAKIREVIVQMKDPRNIGDIVDSYEDILHDIAKLSKNISTYEDKLSLQRAVEDLADREIASIRSTIAEIEREIKNLVKQLNRLKSKKGSEAIRIKRRITRLGLHLKVLKHQVDAIQRVVDDFKEAIIGMPLTMDAIQQLHQYQQIMIQSDQMYLTMAQQIDQTMEEQEEIYDKGVEMALQEIGETIAEEEVEEEKIKKVVKELGEEETEESEEV